MGIEVYKDKFEGVFYKYFKNKDHKHTLLFLHGFTSNSLLWEAYVKKFKSDYSLLLVDLIGHGKSESAKCIEEYSFQNQSDKISKIVDKLEICSVSIVCYSYSTNLGLFVTKKIHKKVKTLVIISPYNTDHYKFLAKQATLFIKFIWNYLIPNKKFVLDYSRIKNYESPTFKDKKYILKSINTKDFLGSVFSYLNCNEFSNIGGFEIPTLIIHGENDKTVSEKIKNNLRTEYVLFEVIKGKKHLFLKTKSNEISKKITNFLFDNLKK